jgi:hypothetical protein
MQHSKSTAIGTAMSGRETMKRCCGTHQIEGIGLNKIWRTSYGAINSLHGALQGAALEIADHDAKCILCPIPP